MVKKEGEKMMDKEEEQQENLEERFENMSESRQESEKGEELQFKIDQCSENVDWIRNAICELTIIEGLEDVC